jgi:hypothetical protein
MGFFARLKSVFSRKPPSEKQDASAAAAKDTPPEGGGFSQASEMQEPVQEVVKQQPVKESVFDPNTTGPNRDSKECPKCGAPNDQDIHKCWLCKSEI